MHTRRRLTRPVRPVRPVRPGPATRTPDSDTYWQDPAGANGATGPGRPAGAANRPALPAGPSAARTAGLPSHWHTGVAYHPEGNPRPAGGCPIGEAIAPALDPNRRAPGAPAA